MEYKRLLEEPHSLPSIEPIKEVLTHEESKESTMFPEVELKVYENSRLYKKRRKRWPDKHIMRRGFHEGELVSLFNSRLKLFPGKLHLRRSGPFKILKVFLYDSVETWSEATCSFKINGQRLKHYREDEPIEGKAVYTLSDPYSE
ncbi:uncharacterized protein LOC130591782 [Beta vulgaris subsp. vulgaris]|uniref:uncharacterized protein LOC130591782 n=1 Tax=Beta vulgaris subsp. vulgaris TaxID=3555 RepID=UPI0025476419|nr:uncharacterized protein LOC130591782 [Beta vulgaris subsp. vulgaris]